MKVVNKMYGGEVEVVFESGRHTYTCGGKIIKSVTKVLDVISKPWLVPWAAKVTVEKAAELLSPGKAYDELELINILDTAKKASYVTKKSAGDIGTLVHNQVEKIVKGQTPDNLFNVEANAAVGRFTDWAIGNKIDFLLSEQMVYSRKYNFCGTLDFACRIDKKLVLGDLKTSNQIDKVNYGAQLAAYRLAREEEFGEKFDRCILVRTGKKEAEFELWEPSEDEIQMYKNVFMSALALSNAIDLVGGK